MKYKVYSTYTQYYVDEVEANSPDEAKSIIDNLDIDELTFDDFTFTIDNVEEADNA
jgi:hypothetical protein